MALIHNERIKLFATALSNTGVATVVTAIVAPMAGFLYGASVLAESRWPLLGLAWFFGGMSLHITAQLVLGRLRDDQP
jgi:hypothetical protein